MCEVINLDNRLHPPAAVQLVRLGHSLGQLGRQHPVDTTNYRPLAFQSISSEQLRITERFTRQDAETISVRNYRERSGHLGQSRGA